MALRFWNVSVFGAVGMVRTLRLGEGSYVVGSDPECDIAALGEGLDRRHALLVLAAQQVTVEDLGSAAGTFLGGQRVEGRLEGGVPATVELGQVRLWVEDAGASTEDGISPEQTLRLVHASQGPGYVHAEPEELTLRLGRQSAFSAADPAASEASVGETLAFRMPHPEVHVAGSIPVRMDYAVNGEIARGGMGRIYAAEDPHLERQVALKVSSLGGPDTEAQFWYEARVLAQLAHPNIVPVYNLGRDSSGRSFYSMKLVQGRTLREVLRMLAAGDPETASYFSRARLLRVFRKVCDAVAFAHDRGFLHRDLKPENVMVGEFGEVLVLDWGLAKALPKKGAPPDVSVPHGFIEGTPQYMSPEQAGGEYAGLDERSDIYSLGGILYSILTLRPPVEGSTVEEVLSKVKNGDTTRMLQEGSDALNLVSYGTLRMLRGIPDALRAVTQKAMAREKHRRYASVQELARDLESYQNGFATSAEEAGLARLAVLFVKRHKMVSTLLLVLLAGAGVFTVRLARSEKLAKESARDARRQAAIASANAARAAENAARADEQARNAAASERLAREEREEARISTANAQLAVAEAAEQSYDAEAMRRALEVVPADLRGQQWRYMEGVRDASERTIKKTNGGHPVAFVPHPVDPEVLFALDQGGGVWTLNTSSGEEKNLFKLEFSDRALAVSPDAGRIAVFKHLSRLPDGSFSAAIHLWDVASGKKQLEIPLVKPPDASALKFSPDGASLLVVNISLGNLKVFDTKTGALFWGMEVPKGLCAAFMKRSGNVATHFGLLWMMSFDRGSGTPLREPARAGVARGFNYGSGERFCADSEWSNLFFIGRDVCRKVETSQGKVEFEIRLPPSAVKRASVVYVPARKMIATLSAVGDFSAVLQLWSEQDGSLVRAFPVEIPRREGEDWSLLLQPGSGKLPERLLVSRGMQLKVFSLPEAGFEAMLGPMDGVTGGCFTFLDEPWKVLRQDRRKTHPDATFSASCDIVDLRASPGAVLSHHEVVQNPHFYPSTSSDGKKVALWRIREREARVFKVAGNKLTEPVVLSVPPDGSNFRLSPDGSRFWAESVVYRTDSGAVLSRTDLAGLSAPPERIPACWVGNTHVIGSMMVDGGVTEKNNGLKKRSLVLWHVEDGARIHTVDAPEVLGLSVSPDGSKVAEAGADMKVRIRNAETLEVEKVLRVHGGPVLAVAWHPKLPVLATCSEDYLVRVWRIDSEEMLQEFCVFPRMPLRLSWSPDGSRLSVQFASGEAGFLSPKTQAQK